MNDIDEKRRIQMKLRELLGFDIEKEKPDEEIKKKKKRGSRMSPGKGEVRKGIKLF
jgi:hypothetical protein